MTSILDALYRTNPHRINFSSSSAVFSTFASYGHGLLHKNPVMCLLNR